MVVLKYDCHWDHLSDREKATIVDHVHQQLVEIGLAIDGGDTPFEVRNPAPGQYEYVWKAEEAP